MNRSKRQSKQTVPTYADEIRAVPAIAGLRNPTLTIGGMRLVFPAELSPGDRLVFDGSQCRVHRKAQADLEWIQVQGGPVTWEQGLHRAVLSFDADLLPQFRVAVSLVKHCASDYSTAVGLGSSPSRGMVTAKEGWDSVPTGSGQSPNLRSQPCPQPSIQPQETHL